MSDTPRTDAQAFYCLEDYTDDCALRQGSVQKVSAQFARQLERELTRAKRNEAICHCGSPLSMHSMGDGHAPVPAPVECPYVDPAADDAPAALTAHIIAEDPRYPVLCINGRFNYGLQIDPETGDIDPQRFCICHARCDGDCICSLEK